MSKPVIELDSVTKMYGISVGTVDISVDVKKGSVYGFLGPNGAGKTTTISMMIGLLRPTAGHIRVLGFDAAEESIEVRKRVGFLAGDMALDKRLTGWQQLEYFGRLRGDYNKGYVAELAERLQCDLSRKFKHLSRGNRQKVGLIAALMHQPELLILDEPTSGLDPLIQAEFNKLILEHKARGGTTFISSHVLSEVQELCDEMAFIRSGKLVAVKRIEELALETPKHFVIDTKDTKLGIALEEIDGVVLSESKKSKLRGSFRGDINVFLKVVVAHGVEDISIDDSDLESTFMTYYSSGGQGTLVDAGTGPDSPDRQSRPKNQGMSADVGTRPVSTDAPGARTDFSSTDSRNVPSPKQATTTSKKTKKGATRA
jgi:ABC-2 type transport system ATP-binding protein